MKVKIRQYRELNNMTQEDLAKKSGISRVTLSGLENGTVDVTTNVTMEKIAKALNVKVSELFFNDDVQ